MGLAKLQKRVGFIGAGQMAEALARGFIAKGVLDASSMVATDPVAARKEVFESFQVKAVDSNIQVHISSIYQPTWISHYKNQISNTEIEKGQMPMWKTRGLAAAETVAYSCRWCRRATLSLWLSSLSMLPRS